MKGVSLTLALIVAFNLANPCFSQIRDIFDACTSMSTSSFCGTPSITREQIRQIEAATETIERIEQIGGPIVDGSPEAAQLGISVENPIVDLTFSQENYYRRCFNSNPFSPASDGFSESEDFRRKKRQTPPSNTCCSPSPNTVRVIATVNGNGRAVQVIQTEAMAQLYQDTSNCPSTSCTGQITCGPVRITVPAEVFNPVGRNIGRGNIIVNICGAVSTSPVG